MNKKIIVFCLLWSLCTGSKLYSRKFNEGGGHLQIGQLDQQPLVELVELDNQFGSQRWLDEIRIADDNLLGLYREYNNNPQNELVRNSYFSRLNAYVANLLSDISFVDSRILLLDQYPGETVECFANVIAEHKQFLSSPPHIENMPMIGVSHEAISELCVTAEEIYNALCDKLDNESDEESEYDDQ